MTINFNLINYLSFNLLWFGLVLVGNGFVPVALLWLTLHIYFCAQTWHELKFIGCVLFIGVGIDTSLLYLGVFDFFGLPFIPLWLIALWGCFAATINHSMKFLSRSKALQWLVGTMLAPLSYIAGYKFGAVNFGYPSVMTYSLLAILWGGLFVLFYAIRDEVFYQAVEKEPSHV